MKVVSVLLGPYVFGVLVGMSVVRGGFPWYLWLATVGMMLWGYLGRRLFNWAVA